MAIALGSIGFRGVIALREHRFEAAVDEIVSKLNLAQHLMLCCRANVSLQIDQDQDNYVLKLVSQDQLPASFEAVIGGEHVLRGVDRLSFEGCEDFPLVLPFARDGAERMPHGVLTLASRTHTLVHIPLPGHFSKITKHYGQSPSVSELQAPPFPQQVAVQPIS